MEATIHEITAVLARTEERLAERIDSAFRDLTTHFHSRFDALEKHFDHLEQGYGDPKGRGQDIE